MLPSASTAQYYVEDSLGTSRVVIANTGVVCYDADFTPFGGERPITNSCTQNNYKFEGKERDVETQNDEFGARYCSSRFGRWLSADWSNVPIPVPYANLSNPQTLNLYSMVADDPESFADLDGHCGETDPCRGPENNVVCTEAGCVSQSNTPKKSESGDQDRGDGQTNQPSQPQEPEPNKPPSSWDSKQRWPDDPQSWAQTGRKTQNTLIPTVKNMRTPRQEKKSNGTKGDPA